MYNDRELLARTLMAEAGGEGRLGLRAAGSVIMNRVNADGYGSTLQDVILAPGQFSAWNSVTGYAGGEGGLDMASMSPSEDAYAVADQLLSGEYEDPTGGATHYYNPSVATPAWGMEAGGEWQAIGNHVFGFADGGARSTSTDPDVGAQINGAISAALLAPPAASEDTTPPQRPASLVTSDQAPRTSEEPPARPFQVKELRLEERTAPPPRPEDLMATASEFASTLTPEQLMVERAAHARARQQGAPQDFTEWFTRARFPTYARTVMSGQTDTSLGALTDTQRQLLQRALSG